ncbi:MAG: chemotaxis-specific protein-glutamate methyltransferase CheB [Bdellovibrionota bacterium]
MRVLIVDDSVVFRSQIRAALEGQQGIEIAGTASNGRAALLRLQQLSVDLVTLDMEMPERGGLETIREIRKARFPVRILAFSAHTTRGSEQALEALAAGADDFVPKPSGGDLSVANAAGRIREQLLPKILQFLLPAGATSAVAPVPRVAEQARPKYLKKEVQTFLPEVLLIGSSTGGPPALELLLKGIASPPRCPVLITQHMPPVFTASLARRLEQSTGVPAKEAAQRESLKNQIYVAPGDFHLTVHRSGRDAILEIDKGPQRNSVRPAVDILFESAAKAYANKAMAFVLTGMGEDGLVGCRAIKGAGGGVMIQNRESCVVFGMPGAVFADGCYDDMGDLAAMNAVVKRMLA